MATTTIAAARQALGSSSSGPSITVNAVVTAVQGPTGDQVIWYVEDPGGGTVLGRVGVLRSSWPPRRARACRRASRTWPPLRSGRS
jgi:hypothetical protein